MRAKSDRTGSVMSSSSMRSLSETSMDREMPVMEKLSDDMINLPMPSPDLNHMTSPSMSRSSSKRLGRRMSISQTSESKEENIGETLEALSRSLSCRSSAFTSMAKHASFSPAARAAQALHSTQSSSSIGHLQMLPGVPVIQDATGDDERRKDGAASEHGDDGARTGDAASRCSTPTSYSGEEDFDEEEVTCTDLAQLQDFLKGRIRQLKLAVEMGMDLQHELKKLREEGALITEERDLLLEENDIFRKEAQEYAINLRKQAKQLSDLKAMNSDLQYRLAQEEEDMKEFQRKLEDEKEAFDREKQEMMENAKWQEEKFVAVQQAAERAAPGNVHVIAMKEALTEAVLRKRYFAKLLHWRVDNGKRRQCYYILRHNLYNTLNHREYLRDLYFQRLVLVAKRGRSRKAAEHEAMFEEAARERKQVEEEASAAMLYEVQQMATRCTVAWQVAVDESDATSGLLLQQLDTEKEISLHQEHEQKWRSDIAALAWQGVNQHFYNAMTSAVDEWVSTKNECDEKTAALARVRERWEEESDKLREACATRDAQLHVYSLKLNESSARVGVAEATVSSHEDEIQKLRADKVNLHKELIAARESLEVSDSDLAKIRAQVCENAFPFVVFFVPGYHVVFSRLSTA